MEEYRIKNRAEQCDCDCCGTPLMTGETVMSDGLHVFCSGTCSEQHEATNTLHARDKMIERAYRRMIQAAPMPAPAPKPAPRTMPAKAGTLFGPPELVQGKLFAAPAPLQPQPYIAPAELAERLAKRPGGPQKASGRIAKAWQRRTAEDERIARQYDAEQTPRLF